MDRKTSLLHRSLIAATICATLLPTPAAICADAANYHGTKTNYPHISSAHPADIFTTPQGITSPIPGIGDTGRTADDVEEFKASDGFVWYRLKRNGLYGIVDANGKVLVPPRYKRATYIHVGGGWYSVSDGKTEGAYACNGKLIIETGKYDELYIHEEEHGRWASVAIGNRYGVCDIEGRVLVEPNAKYKSIFFSDVSQTFKYDSGNGYVSLGVGFTGNHVEQPIPATTTTAQGERIVESNGFVWYRTRSGDNYGARDEQGRTLVPTKYSLITYFPDGGGWFCVWNQVGNIKYEGAYMQDGRMPIPDNVYHSVTLHETDDGPYFGVKKYEKSGACDINGNLVVPVRYKNVFYSSIDGFNYVDASDKFIPLGIRLKKPATTTSRQHQSTGTDDRPSAIKDDSGH